MKKLPNLDGLRFIAATLVLLLHVDLCLVHNHYKQTTLDIFPFNFGENAVVLFFVLSGFLITYLLLMEKAVRKISVKSFYIKRVLRIWPLYYLLIILSFLVFNKLGYFQWHGTTDNNELQVPTTVFVFLLLIICPNVALLFTPSLGYANPAWSIGVEEQFYLLWPHIMKRKKPEVFLALIIILVLCFNYGAIGKAAGLFTKMGLLTKDGTIYNALFLINKFFIFPYAFKIDAMAIGATGAMVAINKPHLLRYIFSVPFQFVCYCMLIFLIFFRMHAVPYQVFSVFFILVILNLALNKKNIFKLEYKPLNYLGKISYGIYIFHTLTVVPAIKFVTMICGKDINIFIEILICLVSSMLTITISSISYKYFESYFLKLKHRWDVPGEGKEIKIKN